MGLSVAAFGLYQILLYTLLLDGRSREVLALAMVVGSECGLDLLFAPRWGAIGAAAAAAASNAAMVLWAARLAERVMPWRFPWARLASIAWRALAAAVPLAWATWPWHLAAPTPWGWVGGALAFARCCTWHGLGPTSSVARMLLPR